MNIIQKTTPNLYVGRRGYKPELIVLHIADGTLAGTDSWFASPKSESSAHYLVGFNGEIHQYVKDEDSAWTQNPPKNPSCKLLKPNVNPNLYCLSIEHEGKDLSIVHEAQINSTVELIRSLSTKWNIPIDRQHIIGHYEINSVTRPNCPATNKEIIDRIVRQAQEQEMVNISVPKNKVDKILAFIKTI